MSRLDAYATEAEKKRALLQCLKGNAMSAQELHGENSAAFTQSRILDEYLVYIQNIFPKILLSDYGSMKTFYTILPQNAIFLLIFHLSFLLASNRASIS